MSDVTTALLDLGGFFLCLWFAVASLFGYALGRVIRRRDSQVPHERQSCARCGRCCCARCTTRRRGQRWVAPSGGGYHACSPARPVPAPPGHRATVPDRGPLVFIAAPTQQAAHHWRASQALNPSHVRLCTTPSTVRGLSFIDGDRLVILDGTPADVRLALAHVRNLHHDTDVTVEVPEVGCRSR